jgi:hypothetical protein
MAVKKEKKIFLEISDTLEEVLEKVEDSSADKLVLNVPKGSAIADSADNFEILKEKARIVGKEISIESVDDEIVALAEQADLSANGTGHKARERAFSDIVASRPKRRLRIEEKQRAHLAEAEILEEKPKPVEFDADAEDERRDKAEKIFETIQAKKKHEEKNVHARFERHEERKAKGNKAKRYVLLAILVLLLAGGGFAAAYVLPEANVELTMKRAEKEFAENVLISINETAPKIEGGRIILPGEVLSAVKNTQVEIAAQGKANVEEKAKGKLTIYNNFDGKPQQLVATTRFESPDGKIFRLVSAVTVPGAKIEGGKVASPSSVEADVVADQAGAGYNVSAQKNWHIPGFKGTPRYDGFTAENKSAMSGGFSGERPQATEADRAAGEAKLKNTLESALTAQMNILLTDKFTLIPGASVFEVTKTELQSDSSRQNIALLYGEADMKKMVFVEDMLKVALAERFGGDLPEKAKVESFTATYGEPQIDWAAGTMQIQISGKAVFIPDIDTGKIVEDIKGKDENELKDYVFALPGLENARVSLWPFWVKAVPKNSNRIDVSAK